MPLDVGQTFAGYAILRRLGAGGMGEVYLAQHPRLPRRDALKLLATDVSAEPNFRQRFLREADLASTLWHPHIVGVHDRGEHEGQLWISMDFVDGQDVRTLMARGYPAGMPAELVTVIVTAIASALDYAHRQGLLHRDVKPANILLTEVDDPEQRRILLTDFGIARTVDDQSGLTATNMTLGTVDYIAPEQLMGEDLDGRADQYALAITAYQLLTGFPPFRDSNPTVVIGRHLNVAPPALAGTRPELAGLDPVLAIALAKNPSSRFASCSDFARALAGQVSRKSVAPTVPAPVTPVPVTPAPAATASGPALAPGWYQDPSGRAEALFWDGRGWRPAAATGGRRAGAGVLLGVLAAIVVLALIGSAVLLWSRQSRSAAPAAAPATVTAGVTAPRPATTGPGRTATRTSTAGVTTASDRPRGGYWSAVVVGTCDEGGTCGVKQRSAPYNEAPRLYPNDLMDGVQVTVACQTTGDTRSSQGQGTSNVWYRLDNGAYVNSVYLSVAGSGIPTC